MFGTRQSNSNDLSADHVTALFVTQAVGAALANFGQNDLVVAANALRDAEESAALIRDRKIRTRLEALVSAAGEAMLVIDIGTIARAASEG